MFCWSSNLCTNGRFNTSNVINTYSASNDVLSMFCCCICMSSIRIPISVLSHMSFRKVFIVVVKIQAIQLILIAFGSESQSESLEPSTISTSLIIFICALSRSHCTKGQNDIIDNTMTIIRLAPIKRKILSFTFHYFTSHSWKKGLMLMNQTFHAHQNSL